MVTAKSAKLFYRQVLVNLVHGNGVTKIQTLVALGHMIHFLGMAGANNPVSVFVSHLPQLGSR